MRLRWRPCTGRRENLRSVNCKPAGLWLYSQPGVQMPLFEYKCRDCGTTFGMIVASSATDAVCKQCASPRVEKLLSAFAVVGSSRSPASLEPGPCGACGAAQRGMCGE
jgi:putative FmdB family regulatory protein